MVRPGPTRSHQALSTIYQACEAGVVSGGARLTKSWSLTPMESYMAWPTVVKLSGIDEGHSVLVLQQKKIELVEVDFLTLLAGPVLERQARARADAAAGLP